MPFPEVDSILRVRVFDCSLSSRSILASFLPDFFPCPSLDLQASNLQILLTISTHSIKTNVRIKLQIQKNMGFGFEGFRYGALGSG